MSTQGDHRGRLWLDWREWSESPFAGMALCSAGFTIMEVHLENSDQLSLNSHEKHENDLALGQVDLFKVGKQLWFYFYFFPLHLKSTIQIRFQKVVLGNVFVVGDCGRVTETPCPAHG